MSKCICVYCVCSSSLWQSWLKNSLFFYILFLSLFNNFSMFLSSTKRPGQRAGTVRHILITRTRWSPRVFQHPRHDHKSQGNYSADCHTYHQLHCSPRPNCPPQPLFPQQLWVSMSAVQFTLCQSFTEDILLHINITTKLILSQINNSVDIYSICCI